MTFDPIVIILLILASFVTAVALLMQVIIAVDNLFKMSEEDWERILDKIYKS